MKKILKYLLICNMAILFFIGIGTKSVFASPGNPYPESYYEGGIYHPGNCTWQAWEEAYTRLGVRLPNWGNAGTWCGKARAAGYQVINYTFGAIPPANCIIEWNGHVGWVIAADSVGAVIREGNIWINNPTVFLKVNEQWWSWDTLRTYRGNPIGFICLAQSAAGVSYPEVRTTYVDTRNAEIYGKISNPGRATISQDGFFVWDSTGKLVVNYTENCNKNNITWQKHNIVEEACPGGLRSGETYTFQLWADANGKRYYSGKSSFTILDKTAPVISNVKITNVTSDGYTVSCKATDNFKINRVQFPTWTSENGQDDLSSQWSVSKAYSGSKAGDIYTFRVNRKDHNNEYGTYYTHIYAYDEAGNQTYAVAPAVNVKKAVPQVPQKIKKSAQKITTGASSYKKTYGNKAFSLKAKSKGNVKLTYKSSSKSVAVVNSSGTVTIKGCGKAVITITANETKKYKKAVKSVTITVSPGKQTVTKVNSSKKKTLTVSWKKDSKATGYEIQYAKNKYFILAKKMAVTKNHYTKKTINNLSRKKNYYVRVRSYKLVGKTKLYGQWSAAKRVKIK